MGRKDIKVQRWASHSLGIIFFVLSSQNLVSSPIDHHQERFEDVAQLAEASVSKAEC